MSLEKFDIEDWCLSNIDSARINGTRQCVGVCPWCSKSDKLYVSVETGKYICFSCNNAGSNIIGLISQVEGIDRSEAMRFMMRNKIEFRRKSDLKSLNDNIISIKEECKKEPEVNEPLPKGYIPIYDGKKWRYPLYLKERGIAKMTAYEYGIGYCRVGRYANRIIIPIVCPNGRSFTARDVTGKEEQKYLNPYNVDHKYLMLGWYNNKTSSDLTLVEGPLDAIKMHQHGIYSVALLGKVLHGEQMEMLITKPKDTSITVMLDPEEVEAPYKVADLLLCWFDNVYIAKLPLGVDPGSSSREQAKIAYKNADKYTGNRIFKISSIIDRTRTALKKIH